MNVLALDTEGPRFDDREKWRGNAYGDPNDLVCWSWATASTKGAKKWGPSSVAEISALCLGSLIVVANGKHDLHWMKRYGFTTEGMTFWDVLVAEFIISHQRVKFPSLDYCCEKYGIPKKLDIVKQEYWEKGIDTKDIPWPILQEYAAHDSFVTREVCLAQLKIMTPEQIKLCKLQCMDLMVLQEMEANGILYDEQLCHERSKEIDDQISEIKRTLAAYYPGIPINFGSTDHLSAFLYGGIVKEDAKEHIGFYKTGAKAGQPKYKNVLIEHSLPRLFEPLKGSELKKEGMFATDESTLRKLKGNKKLVEKLLLLAKLEKMNGTYYQGIPKLRKEMNWPENMLHGNFNQTQAATGRLSSSKPNLQNFSTELQDIFVSRYE